MPRWWIRQAVGRFDRRPGRAPSASPVPHDRGWSTRSSARRGRCSTRSGRRARLPRSFAEKLGHCPLEEGCAKVLKIAPGSRCRWRRRSATRRMDVLATSSRTRTRSFLRSMPPSSRACAETTHARASLSVTGARGNAFSACRFGHRHEQGPQRLEEVGLQFSVTARSASARIEAKGAKEAEAPRGRSRILRSFLDN